MGHITNMITLIDNYDSFTFNLVQYFGDLGHEPEVFRNDKISVDEVFDRKPEAIIISPGPGDPDHSGICLDLIKRTTEEKVPLFGVCLGHQAIGQAFGGKVIRAPEPLHGKISYVHHCGKSVFEGMSNPFSATRYHSLIVDRETIPECLEITAETEDGIVMGLAHRDLPICGVQFHPESIATENGHKMLENFIKLI